MIEDLRLFIEVLRQAYDFFDPIPRVFPLLISIKNRVRNHTYTAGSILARGRVGCFLM
jgi:hypothetical protein